MKSVSKFIMLLSAVLFLGSCDDKPVDAGLGGGVGTKMDGVVLTFDKSVIKASGSDVVTFNAYYKGQNVTNEASFFIVKGGKYEKIDSRWSTDQVGEYSFQAGYKTGYSDIVSISAITRNIPAAAPDNGGNSTAFVHRVFLNQHTGAQCPNCPFMTHLLRKTLTDDVKDKVVLASVRNYSGESGFANIPNPRNSWPYLHIDYDSDYQYNGSVEGLQSKIESIASVPAKVGISAVPVYYAEDGQIIVKVAVKAAETAEYNVGLWLMQDNYKKTQQVDASRLSILEGTWGSTGEAYHIHDNCVRVAESKYLGAHVGYPLGRIEKGDTAEWIFLVNVRQSGTEDLNEDGVIDHKDGSWWETKKEVALDELHFAAFVTTHEGNVYNVVNAIDFKYNETREFEYIK